MTEQVSEVPEQDKAVLFPFTETELWRQPAAGQGQKLNSTEAPEEQPGDCSPQPGAQPS